MATISEQMNKRSHRLPESDGTFRNLVSVKSSGTLTMQVALLIAKDWDLHRAHALVVCVAE